MSSINEDNSSGESVDIDDTSLLPLEKRSGEEAESHLKSSRTNESKIQGSMSSRKKAPKSDEERKLQILENLLESALNERSKEEVNFLLPILKQFKVLKVKPEDETTQEDVL